MNVGVFVWEVNRWLLRFMKILQKLHLSCLFSHFKTEINQTKLCISRWVRKEPGETKILHKYMRCLVFAGAGCLLKRHERSLAAHLATHSSSFSCHFENHSVTAGQVLSQDLTVEANGKKFRLCCTCGVHEEVMEQCRAVENLLLLQDSLQ